MLSKYNNGFHRVAMELFPKVQRVALTDGLHYASYYLGFFAQELEVL